MAISNSSKRIQLTLNAEKEKEKVVLDYLSNSFNDMQEIKRILYEYIVNQSGVKKSRKSKSKNKVMKDNKDDEKLLTSTISKTKKAKDTTSDRKVMGVNESVSKSIKETQDNSRIKQDTQNDDIIVDLSQFEDKPVEVIKPDNKVEELRQKKLKTLQQFM